MHASQQRVSLHYYFVRIPVGQLASGLDKGQPGGDLLLREERLSTGRQLVTTIPHSQGLLKCFIPREHLYTVFVLNAYETRRLDPRLSIYLHWHSLVSQDGNLDTATL